MSDGKEIKIPKTLPFNLKTFKNDVHDLADLFFNLGR